jgi:CheY-like chemotaxis protein
MGKLGVASASSAIEENLLKGILRPSPESKQAVKDFLLAAQVGVALTKEGHDVQVSTQNGAVTLVTNKNVLRLSRLDEELKKIVEPLPSVKSVKTEVGKEFHQSNIYRKTDFKMPSKVLLVDDEREFVQTLSERLNMRDMGSAVVYDGEAALNMVQDDEPEVLVIDLKMPNLDGFEVLKKVKVTHPEIEVIVLTGHGSEDDRLTCMELGAFAYMQKPVDIEELSFVLKEAQAKIRQGKEIADSEA